MKKTEEQKITKLEMSLMQQVDQLKNRNSQTDKLLMHAANEIKQLRHENREQAIRLQMFDDCMAILNSTRPTYGLENKPDIVSEIENYVITGKQV